MLLTAQANKLLWCITVVGKEDTLLFHNYKYHKCDKLGHLQTVCSENTKMVSDKQSRAVQLVYDKDTNYESHIIMGGHKEGNKVLVRVNDKALQIKLDTGATVSVISEHDWKKQVLERSLT